MSVYSHAENGEEKETEIDNWEEGNHITDIIDSDVNVQCQEEKERIHTHHVNLRLLEEGKCSENISSNGHDVTSYRRDESSYSYQNQDDVYQSYYMIYDHLIKHQRKHQHQHQQGALKESSSEQQAPAQTLPAIPYQESSNAESVDWDWDYIWAEVR